MFSDLWLWRRAKALIPFSARRGDDTFDEHVRKVITKDNFPQLDEESLEDRRQKWNAVLRRFQSFGRSSTGNTVSVLEGGDECYAEMLACMSSARVRIWCESYIMDSSRVGELFFRAFLAAAQRGCDVVLVVDYIGSFSLRADWVEELRAAGAEVLFFNPVLPSSACVGPWPFRDHRKTMICDSTGFCGGMNLHEDSGETIYGTSKFYDVHARLEGPCVADLADVFRDSLCEAGNRIVRPSISVPPHIEHGVYVQILQSNVRQRRRTLQKVILEALDAADTSVFLTTAYFFPPSFLHRALLRVPARGASLSILLSGSSDFYPLPGDLLSQTHFLASFLKGSRGMEDRVTVQLYERQHMHAKHLSIDGVFGTLGSFNFDRYSSRRNLEVGIAVFDHNFARRLQALHEQRSLEARKTTLCDWVYNNFFARATCAIAFGCIWLSGKNYMDGLDCFDRKWLVRKATLTFLLEEQAAQFVATSMMWGLQ